MKRPKRFLFYSQYAFYGPLYEVFEQLCADFGLAGFVITHQEAEIPKVYSPEGYLTPRSAGLMEAPDFVTAIPKHLALHEKLALLKERIRQIQPDFIWAHEEPSDLYVNAILRWFYFRRTPRIVVPVVQNIWPCRDGFRARIARFRRKLLWRRFSGVLGAATKSVEAVQRFGMPRSVKTRVAWLPHMPPPPTSNGSGWVALRKDLGEFFIGFAGRITAAKGWRVLLAAVSHLPDEYKCLIAGTGEEDEELQRWCRRLELQSRVRYFGVLPKDQLWNFYRALDVFVLPSLTTPDWTEQFGSVLAEAIACAVPVIGSSSGAIPEVVGNCGMIVKENDPAALARAICALANDPTSRTIYAERGVRRFEQEFSHKAYAAKLASALGLKQTEI